MVDRGERDIYPLVVTYVRAIYGVWIETYGRTRTGGIASSGLEFVGGDMVPTYLHGTSREHSVEFAVYRSTRATKIGVGGTV